HIKAGFRHTRPHFARLLVVFIVFLEAGGSKNGNTRTFKVQTTEAFDELKKDAEGEGEFCESTSWPLVNFKIVIAVVSVFFCHGFVSNIIKKAPAQPGLGKNLFLSIRNARRHRRRSCLRSRRSHRCRYREWHWHRCSWRTSCGWYLHRPSEDQ
ncbi:MAG: hypothetical protein RLZZ548_861, partial [Bacteroidota bacterium]